MNDLISGRVVVITGAARGIGESLARAFLQRGAHVVAMDRQWDKEAPFYAELVAAGGLPISCDITHDLGLEQSLQLCVERFGTVDVLINNAAMRQRDFYPETGACAVLDTTDEQWEQMFKVNVVGTLKVIRRFIQPMLKQGRGSVVNISANGSLTKALGGGVSAGNHPEFLNQPYDATKAALTSMGFYLAEEVRAANVAVNTVFPGATLTTGSEALSAGRESLGFMTQLLDADHVVPVCLHLAAQDAGGVTGKAFDVVPWSQAQANERPASSPEAAVATA